MKDTTRRDRPEREPVSLRVAALVWLGLVLIGWATIGLGVVVGYRACVL